MMNAYNTAYNKAIWVDLNERGRIQLEDRDRLQLIHRMSTNDLLNLKPGQGASTVLTTPIGRIIDQLLVLHDGDRAIAITGRGRGEQIRGYFQRNIFFNDQVRQTSLDKTMALYGLYGTEAALLLDERGFEASKLPLYHFTEHDGMLAIRVKPLAAQGFWLLGNPAKLAALKTRLLEQEIAEGDAEAVDLLRIESGYAEVGHELTEDYIPLEAGLWDAVSFKKGCYTGQEIIARMESRGKLSKMLMRLSLEQPLPTGSDLYQNGQKVGTLTSIAAHPAGYYLGLGFVKTPAAVDKQHLQAADGTPIQMLGIAGTQPER